MTTGGRLVEMSRLSSGTAMDHLLSIRPGVVGGAEMSIEFFGAVFGITMSTEEIECDVDVRRLEIECIDGVEIGVDVSDREMEWDV